jgi:hypothetical protein
VLKPTDQYKYCNHHHVPTKDHVMVDFGDGSFIANRDAVALLQALNEIGLKTRTHHVGSPGEYCFVSILMDRNVQMEIKQVFENDADRTRYNGKTELILSWVRPFEDKAKNEI